MKRWLPILLGLVLAAALAGAVRADTCDQGAPGRQGPWGVYCLPTGTSVISKFSFINSLPSVLVANGSPCTEQVTIHVGVSAGLTCAIGGPDNPGMTVQCIAADNQVKYRFCNAAAIPVTSVAGNYTSILF